MEGLGLLSEGLEGQLGADFPVLDHQLQSLGQQEFREGRVRVEVVVEEEIELNQSLVHLIIQEIDGYWTSKP